MPSAAAGRGRATITVHVPDIGGLLPVYIADHYEGFEVKTFAELSDAELETYIEDNVTAIREIADRTGGIDAALSNHLVMGPVILARAGLGREAGGRGYASKIHGSALEFTVKPHLERFGPFAREGVDAASGVLVGSRHTAESLWAALDDPGLPERTRLGPPGVDLELFAPIDASEVEPRLAALAADLRAAPDDPEAAFARDPAEAAAAVEHVAGATARRVVFVGKLMDTKGVDLLLAAWPVVLGENPGSRLVIAGFGEGRERIERFAEALAAGDLAAAAEIARRIRGRAGVEDDRLPSSPTPRRATPGSPPVQPGRSPSPAASSTRRSATWCPPATPWSCRAPSPRPSGWLPPRPRPPGSCR